MTDNNDAILMTAERRGREIARIGGAFDSRWEIECADNREGYALAAAARWIARLGGIVSVRLQRPEHPSSVWRTVTLSCGKQGFVDESAGAAGNTARLIANGKQCEIAVSPDDDAAWKIPLAEAAPFVMPAAKPPIAVSCAQSREIDRIAIQEFGVPGICLMENAAVASAIVALDALSEAKGPVLIAAGGGNNGGDGLALARGLASVGIAVDVALFKSPESLTGDAGINFRLLCDSTAVPIHSLHDDPDRLSGLLAGKRLVVDALLGTGFHGSLSPLMRTAIQCINGSGAPILALDIPSGMDGDSGAVREEAIRATRTITFAAVKTGLLNAASREHVGHIYLGDIGAPAAALPLGNSANRE